MATLGEFISEGSATTKLLLHLNGNSTDSSGSGNNGTDTNITYSLANGRFGQGAGFNGTSSNITLSSDSNITTFTLSAWIKGTTFNGSGENIIIGRTATGLHYHNYYFLVSSGKLLCGFYNGSTYVSVSQATATMSTGVWYHVSATVNSGVINLYINGALVVTGSGKGTPTPGTGQVSSVGANVAESGDYFNGSIDEVIISNYAWSATKIAKYYSFARGRFGII